MLLNQPQSKLGQFAQIVSARSTGRPTIKRCEIYYQLLAVVLLSEKAKVLESSLPYPGYGHPNEHKVYRVSIHTINRMTTYLLGDSQKGTTFDGFNSPLSGLQ